LDALNSTFWLVAAVTFFSLDTLLELQSKPAGMINVGYALNPKIPSPLFLSQPDIANDAASIANCNEQKECKRPLPNSFEQQTYHVNGRRICSREAWQVNLQLQKSTMFQNGATMLPLFWQAEHFCTSTIDWYDMNQIEYLWIAHPEFTTHAWAWTVFAYLLGAFCCYKAFSYNKINIDTPYTDTCCV